MGGDRLMQHIQITRESSVEKEILSSLENLRYKTRRRYSFLILSCYIDTKAIRLLLEKITSHANIDEVQLAFEATECWRNRTPDQLAYELDQLGNFLAKKSIRFQFFPLRVAALMHAKAYAIVQSTPEGFGEGLVWTGSSNATRRGLGNQWSGAANVELMTLSSETSSVSTFVDIWNELISQKRDLDFDLAAYDSRVFSYGLLSSGIFLHNWQGTLSGRVGIRYALTQEGRAAVTVDPELKAFGFDVDQVTLSRNPLASVTNLGPKRALPATFTRRYCLDTNLGKWCPRDVWNAAEDSIWERGEFDRFRDNFLSATDEEALSDIVIEEEKICDKLLQRGLIKYQDDRFSRWVDKIRALRENDERLKRIFMHLEAFELPYEFKDVEMIETVEQSLLATLELASKKNLTARKLEEAIASQDLSYLAFDDEEVEKVQKFLQHAPVPVA